MLWGIRCRADTIVVLLLWSSCCCWTQQDLGFVKPKLVIISSWEILPLGGNVALLESYVALAAARICSQVIAAEICGNLINAPLSPAYLCKVKAHPFKQPLFHCLFSSTFSFMLPTPIKQTFYHCVAMYQLQKRCVAPQTGVQGVVYAGLYGEPPDLVYMLLRCSEGILQHSQCFHLIFSLLANAFIANKETHTPKQNTIFCILVWTQWM